MSSLIYKFVFFCIQHFCTWFCHRPTTAVVGRAPALASQSPKPRSGRATAPVDHNSHATQRLCPGCATAPTDCASHATQRRPTVPPTPRNGATALCHGHCRLRPATITQQPPSKLINGKNQKTIWPNMDLNFAPLGQSHSISTARPPPLMWCVVLFKFTYNCPFVNNV
jgi:hypothetical protein